MSDSLDREEEETSPPSTEDVSKDTATLDIENDEDKPTTSDTLPSFAEQLTEEDTKVTTVDSENTAPILEPSTADEPEEEDIPVRKPVPVPTTTSSRAPMDLFDDDEVDEPTASANQEAPSKAADKEEEEEEDEHGDTFELDIKISDPVKVGDGMGAYIAYIVSTKTTIPSFKSPESSVRRRFSDFLGLHSRLSERYLAKGHIVPPAPEKSVVGMTKVKFTKTEDGDFIERRRAALERYMNRLASHPIIRKDDILKDFLENPAELPKSSDTAAMSGAGFMRLVKSVGETISKIGSKKGDSDTWFEDQQQAYETLDTHLKKLHSAIETMIASRSGLCGSINGFVKSVATLGNVEENDTVSRALSRLSEVEEKVETLHTEQIKKDLYLFAETVKDYIAMLASIKVTFQMRVKLFNTWQSAQTTLAKKRDSEVKLQAGGKPDKIAQIKQEIKEWEEKVEEGQKNFEKASKILKKEVKRFEVERASEFKMKFINYLESLMNMQQQLITLWEGYLPDAQAIA